HDAFGVQRPAQLGLALDVGDPAGTEASARRDATWPAEGKGAKLQTRQTINLPDLGTVGVHQHYAAIDDLLGPIAQSIRALSLLVDGPRHVLLGRHFVLGLIRPIVRLAHDVGD